MDSYKKALNTIDHNKRTAQLLFGIIGILALSVPLRGLDQKGRGNSLGVVKVVAVRRMSEAEHSKRTDDFIGATYKVRLRFEAPDEGSVMLYAPYCGKPDGYVLERKDGRPTWLAAARGGDPTKSPGFKALELQIGACWLLMTAGSAYEWETEADLSAAAQQARSVFIRLNKDANPVEMLSPWYTGASAATGGWPTIPTSAWFP